MKEWLATKEASKAAELFRLLCRRAHGGSRDRDDHAATIVSRQWFSSLQPLAKDLDPQVQRRMIVRELPNVNVDKPGSCSIAGQMYLAVLADSALPEKALWFVHSLTTREAELDRLREGIGLPTRSDFYEPPETGGAGGNGGADELTSKPLSITPYLSLCDDNRRLKQIIENAYRRSPMPRYAEAALSLAPALDSILNFDPGERDEEAPNELIKEFIAKTLLEVRTRIEFAERGKGHPAES